MDNRAIEGTFGLLLVPSVRILKEILSAHAQAAQLTSASPLGWEQTTSVRAGQLQLKRVSSTNRIHSGMAKGVEAQALVADTISHHGFASSYQKQPVQILRFGS